MILKFGKHKGKHIKDVPADYLDWMLLNVDSLTDFGRRSIEAELENRLHPARDVSKEIQQVFRAMSKKYHPDAGGTNSQMQAINDFYQQLKQVIN